MIIIQMIIFVLLAVGSMIAFKIDFSKKEESMLSFSKIESKNKRKKIDEKAEIRNYEKFVYVVDNMLLKIGKKRDYLYKLMVIFFISGIVIGSICFKGIFLSISTGFSMLPMVYIFLALKSHDKIRQELSQLQNTMSIITNGYMATNNIVLAVERYIIEKNRYTEEIGIDKEITAFDEFLSNCLYISSNIDRNLSILASKINNRHFDSWVKILRLCIEDKQMRFALQPVIDAMADEKIMQIEQDTQMKKSYGNYIMVMVAMFATILVFRIARKEWYEILVGTPGGKIILFLMLISAVFSGIYVIKVTKPIGNV